MPVLFPTGPGSRVKPGMTEGELSGLMNIIE